MSRWGYALLIAGVLSIWTLSGDLPDRLGLLSHPTPGEAQDAVQELLRKAPPIENVWQGFGEVYTALADTELFIGAVTNPYPSRHFYLTRREGNCVIAYVETDGWFGIPCLSDFYGFDFINFLPESEDHKYIMKALTHGKQSESITKVIIHGEVKVCPDSTKGKDGYIAQWL